MVLAGWNIQQALRFSIDSSYIDTTLSGIPILLNLSTSCGTAGYNASDVFTK